MTHTLPQSALACPTCKALKEAGYPQMNYRGQRFYMPFGLQPATLETRSTADHDLSDAGDLFAVCPNSDELLAAIQERWPEHEVHTSTGPKGGVSQATAGDRTQRLADFMLVTQPTLAEALAALYIALAGGGA